MEHIIKVTIWKGWNEKGHQVRITGIPSGVTITCFDRDNLLLQFSVDAAYEIDAEAEIIGDLYGKDEE